MKKNNKGFTLAELLIVVAIIAVLVAIAIPVFTTQLEKSREATDLANIRSAYAELVTEYLGNGTVTSVTVDLKQAQTGWNYVDAVIGTEIGSTGGKVDITGNPTKGGTCTVSINDTTGVISAVCA